MENSNQILEWFHQIDHQRNTAFSESFRGIPLDGYGQSGPDFYAYLPEENRHYAKSPYYYNQKLEFFHLTSINNLWSILNSRAFRLYNLHSSKDEQEYRCAAEVLELSDEFIDQKKHYTYTFSFCPFSELKTKNVWEIYGDSFKGAAIIFEIMNDPGDWINFHISEIKYNDLESFFSFRNKIKSLEHEKGIREKTDLSKLICFHKTAKWANEKEVRIATYLPYKHIEEYLKYSKTEFRIEPGRNRITNYIELPLWVDNESSYLKSYGKPELDRTQNLPVDYFKIRPKIKIKDILIGKNAGIPIEDFQRFRIAILDTIRFNYGYDINLSYNFFDL